MMNAQGSLWRQKIQGFLIKNVKKILHFFAVIYHRASLNGHFRWINKRVKTVRGKEKIRVLFEVRSLPMWKSQSVLDLMVSMDRFEPCICALPIDNDTNEEEKEKRVEEIVEYFSKQNVKVVRASSEREAINIMSPDIFFIYQPYVFSLKRLLTDRMKDTLYCYIPYSLRNTENPEAYNNVLQNKYWFNFVENDYIKSVAEKIMYNKGRNVFVTGYPSMDKEEDKTAATVWKYCGDKMKRVIWAPHWSIDISSSYTYVVSTFLKIAEDMVSIAEEYKNTVQFAFKPHPWLYRTLCNYPAWGKEKTDAYYKKWREMPNTQIEQGKYEDLFTQSDAMIHDSGSFIIEYLVCNKPCMYLQRDNQMVTFNKMTQDAMSGYEIGNSVEHVRCFLDTVLMGKVDTKKNKKEEFIRTYITAPHGKTAAQNIVDAILGREV